MSDSDKRPLTPDSCTSVQYTGMNDRKNVRRRVQSRSVQKWHTEKWMWKTIRRNDTTVWHNLHLIQCSFVIIYHFWRYFNECKYRKWNSCWLFEKFSFRLCVLLSCVRGAGKICFDSYPTFHRLNDTKSPSVYSFAFRLKWNENH